MTATITPAPALVKRDGYTWGYVNGNSNSALTCPGLLTPTLVGYGNFLGCCDQASCVGAWHFCNAYLGTGCPNAAICSTVYTSFTQCGASAPSCISYVLVSGVEETNGITSYSCGATGGLVRLLSTITGTAAPTSSSANNKVTATTAFATSNLFSLPSASANSGGGTSSATSGGLSLGAKIGIAVGAIFGAAVLLAFLAWLMYKIYNWKKERSRRRRIDDAATRYADTDAPGPVSYPMNRFLYDNS